MNSNGKRILLGFPNWTLSKIMQTEPRAIRAFLIELSIAVSVLAFFSVVGIGLGLWSISPAFSEEMQECVDSNPPTFGCGLVGVLALAYFVTVLSLIWLIVWAVSVVGWLIGRCIRIPLAITGAIHGCCHWLVLNRGNRWASNPVPGPVLFGLAVGICIILSGYAALYITKTHQITAA